MNLAELDPRDEWWADLCAEVAQAAPARYAFLPAGSPEPDGGLASPEPASAADAPLISRDDAGVAAETDSGAGNPT
jgi:hypothetical protein